jgi:hypothetical protein
MIARTQTINQERIAPMLTYFSTVWGGEADPLWPHVVLLSVSIFAAFTVGAGILLESPKYSAAIHKLATWMVLGGIAVESLCTVLLFVFDERVSARQDSIISGQNKEIISLQKRLAARTLSDDQLEGIANKLRPFGVQHFDIVAYWKNPESLLLANRIYEAIIKAGWVYDKPASGEFILGVETGVIVWFDHRSPPETSNAAREFIEALNESGIEAIADPVPQNANNPIVTHIQINVGIKP